MEDMKRILGAVAAVLVLGAEAADQPWPKVTPEYYDWKADPAFRIEGPYYQGGFISAADDTGTVGKHSFVLKKTFALAAKPVEAHLQGIGDANAVFSLNGREAAKSTFSYAYGWIFNQAFDVRAENLLVAGDNELTVRYEYVSEVLGNGMRKHNHSGGAVAELAVRYADGRWERIDLDAASVSSVDGKSWKGVTVGELPPAPPRMSRLNYVDYVKNMPVTEVREHAGRPCFYLNGEPFPTLWGCVFARARPDGSAVHSKMPLTLITVSNLYTTWHPRAGVYDFSVFDRLAETYQKENPGAYLMWDLTVYPADDFKSRCPEEMSADEKGDIQPVGRFSYSYASRKAMDEMKEMVEKAVRHLEASAYAHRIAGYRVNSGTTIEWLGWDSKPGTCRDFSKVNAERFAAFAAARYPELKDPHVPTYAERRELDGESDILWNRAKHLNAIAYNEYDSWIIAEDAMELCGHAGAVLKSLGRTKVVGTYYGYTWFLNGSGSDVYRGHFALRHLIEANNGRIDFLMSPQCYGSQRNFGETFGDMKPFATLRMNGLASFIEDDTRTCNRVWPEYKAYVTAPNHWLTEQILARNGAFAVCRGTDPYYYALSSPYDLNSPECAKVGTNILAAVKLALTRNVRRHAEVALVASEQAIVASPVLRLWGKTGNKARLYGADGSMEERDEKLAYLNGEICNAVQSKFNRSGAPVDLLLAEDLGRHPGDYRLYVFMNQLTYDDKLLAAVRTIRERGATVLWVYAPGFAKDHALASMRELTGLEFTEMEGPFDCGVVMKDDGRWMGMVDSKVARGYRPKAPETVLGETRRGEPALTRNVLGSSKTYFSAGWQLDMKFVRQLVKDAGVFVYSDGEDPMEANDAFFALHARNGGTKTVRLPHKVKRVVDMFARKLIATDADTFSFDARLHESFLFYCGD